MLEADGINDTQMKEEVKREYYRRVRTILKSKLNGANTIRAINSRAVSVVKYSAGIINWKKHELQNLDRKTQKDIVDV